MCAFTCHILSPKYDSWIWHCLEGRLHSGLAVLNWLGCIPRDFPQPALNMTIAKQIKQEMIAQSHHSLQVSGKFRKPLNLHPDMRDQNLTCMRGHALHKSTQRDTWRVKSWLGVSSRTTRWSWLIKKDSTAIKYVSEEGLWIFKANCCSARWL